MSVSEAILGVSGFFFVALAAVCAAVGFTVDEAMWAVPAFTFVGLSFFLGREADLERKRR